MSNPSSAEPETLAIQPMQGRAQLRLAYPGPTQEDARQRTVAQRRGRDLLGVSPGPLDWRASALHDLLRTLHPRDGALRILSVFDGQPRVRVELYDTPGQGQADERLDWALRAAWPMFVFGRRLGAAEAPYAEWPVQHVLQVRPLRLQGRQGNRRGTDAETREAWIPHPGRWPGAWLVSPFNSPLHHCPWALDIVLRPWSPDEKLRREWWRLLQDLKRGSLRAWHPAATEACPLQDADLDAAAQDLLRGWQREADQGYAAQVRIRSPEALDPWALRRLARDVFGLQPTRVLTLQAAVQLPPELRGVWLPEQGEGGWMPLPAGLLQAGMPAAAREPSRLAQGPGAEIGQTASGRIVPVPAEIRDGHMLVVGASGTGKSTTLCRLLQQDMEQGAGVVLIDPHGDLFDQVIDLVPAARKDDVVMIDAADATTSVAINPLEGTATQPALRSLVAGTIVDLIGHLFENPESTGPVLRNHLRHALLLAMCHPSGGTLADAPRIFLEPDFRSWLLSKADRRLQAYFEGFERTNGEHGFANWLPYIMARFEPFRSNRTLLATLSRPSTVDLVQALRAGAIVLVRIPRHLMTETECRVFGALMLMSCFRAALGSGDERLTRPCRMVVDEFHLFATPAVPALFREARKFGLALTVATQSFGSLRHPQAPNLVTDVLTNTAAKLLFRVSPSESTLLEEYTAPAFDAKALTRMANRKAVLALPSLDLDPVLLDMLPPIRKDHLAVRADLLAASRDRHATPMQQVLDDLARRHGLDASGQ